MQKAVIGLWLLALGSSALDICDRQEDGTRLAHPLDCAKFVVCFDQRTSQIASCPNGLHFNRHVGACDWKSRSGCEPSVRAPDELGEAATECCSCCSCCSCCCNDCCKDPTTPSPGPITPGPDPVTPDLGPTTPDPEPITPDVGPTTPGPDPVTPDLGPTTPGPDPVTPDLGPTTPDPEPITPDVGPTTPGPDPVTPDLGPTTPGPDPVTPDNDNSTLGPMTGPSGILCNHPGLCAGQKDGTMFADSSANGYIVCQCECEIQRPCPPGLVFNTEFNVCDWPDVD